MTRFEELSLDAFGEALASAAPTPGGGSASALAGALGAALVAMVARTTAGNASFADRAGEMNAVAAEADRLRAELLGLVQADAAAFDQVMAAFRLPKETPEQRAERSRAIQAGFQAATEPPLTVCEQSLRVLELSLRVAEEGNPNAVSDAGVACLLAASALEGAALNVRINLASIQDEEFRVARGELAGTAETRAAGLREQTLAAVRAKLG